MNMWGHSICYRFAAVTPLPLIELRQARRCQLRMAATHQHRRACCSSCNTPSSRPKNGVPTMGFYGPLRRCGYTHAEAASTGVARRSSACCSPRIRITGRQWKTTARGEATCFRKRSTTSSSPATNLLITDYPNSGASEMRSWCHETVAADWQKFLARELQQACL